MTPIPAPAPIPPRFVPLPTWREQFQGWSDERGGSSRAAYNPH